MSNNPIWVIWRDYFWEDHKWLDTRDLAICFHNEIKYFLEIVFLHNLFFQKKLRRKKIIWKQKYLESHIVSKIFSKLQFLALLVSQNLVIGFGNSQTITWPKYFDFFQIILGMTYIYRDEFCIAMASQKYLFNMILKRLWLNCVLLAYNQTVHNSINAEKSLNWT